MRVNPHNVALVRAIDEILAPRARPVVAMLTEGEDSKLARLLERRHNAARIVTVTVDGSTSETHVRLASGGRLDLVVDDTRVVRRDLLFRSTFWHLRDGGAYLVRNFRPNQAGDASTVLRLVCELLDLQGRRLPRKPTRRLLDDAALASSLAAVVITRQHIQVTHRGVALAKIAEHEVAPLLGQRPDRGRVLLSEPSTELVSRARVRESESPRSGKLPSSFRTQAPALREYENVLCRPGQVVIQRNVVLPDSYRHIPQPRLFNSSIEDAAPRFARTPRGGGRSTLEGNYYYLDSEFRGHFGHAITEQVSRLWGWEQAKASDPGLKLLMAARGRDLAQYEIDLYQAAGIDASDIVLFREPVRVNKLIVATPLFSMPWYVHPRIEDTWNQLGRNLASMASDRHYPERIFLARRPKRRPCRNAQEVEEFFARSGFDIVFAEDHSLAEQARMFRGAEAVAGLAGSALFTLCLAEAPKRVFLVSSESFTAINEYMISAVRGHTMDIAWCRSEVPMPESGWDKRAFFAPFALDWDREGQFLKEAVESL